MFSRAAALWLSPMRGRSGAATMADVRFLLVDERLAEGAGRSSLEELTDWALWADRVVSF